MCKNLCLYILPSEYQFLLIHSHVTQTSEIKFINTLASQQVSRQVLTVKQYQSVIFHWLSETKYMENVFLAHHWGPGNMSHDLSASLLSCICHCFPTLSPTDFTFSISWLTNSLNVHVQVFCWNCNKGQVVAVSLVWLPMVRENGVKAIHKDFTFFD